MFIDTNDIAWRDEYKDRSGRFVSPDDDEPQDGEE